MKTIRVGLAPLRQPESVLHGVAKINAVLARCAAEQVAIACFPEAYLPGLRGASFDLPAVDQVVMEEALKRLRAACRTHRVAAIVGLEWVSELGLENRAVVISAAGRVLGYQTKNQITPGGESRNYVPDGKRRVFRTAGAVFGITICHEGWRYPETVRWPAVRGARIVFQPQVTGSDKDGKTLTAWGESFYEKAMLCRAEENSVYFASVNQAMRYQNSATSLIDPQGNLLAHVPYGKEDLLVADLDLTKATRFYARRYDPDWYPE
ncbi:MAG: carbon-nitrogen hydrolase family protein [Chloroflexota bacterium]|nr:carbon-nitrogen hydrolase family protein [Chloroflexota bacterium]MDE2839600.1 carbon-nitrogen hydrolase family protein [Chloroflexota bacterium]MDE2930139.1 carbon-nitrogen hydrolase family protein [Chloroflexota bacterium]